jgi:hypothetical protein
VKQVTGLVKDGEIPGAGPEVGFAPGMVAEAFTRALKEGVEVACTAAMAAGGFAVNLAMRGLKSLSAHLHRHCVQIYIRTQL